MTSDAAIRSLKSEISGQVLTPVDGGFDAARAVFNTMMRGRITRGQWREVRTAVAAEAQIRSTQCVPDEPERHAGRVTKFKGESSKWESKLEVHQWPQNRPAVLRTYFSTLNIPL